jgi:hypothetical protein
MGRMVRLLTLVVSTGESAVQARGVVGDPQQQRPQALWVLQEAQCSGRQLAFSGENDALSQRVPTCAIATRAALS